MRFLEVAEKGWIVVIVQPCEEHSDKKNIIWSWVRIPAPYTYRMDMIFFTLKFC